MTLIAPFSIEVNLADTGEVFPVDNVSSFTKIGDLKVKLELIAGIPTHLQRIMYLDQGDMEDNSTLKHHDVVSGARLTMHIWSSWLSLIKASIGGNIKKVMNSGVTADSNFSNPNIAQMSAEARKQYFLSRSAIALYVATHRGHVNLMHILLKSGADIAAQTKNGRNTLHVAAASGKNESIEVLLAYGAGEFVNNEDNFGETPLQVATEWGHKSSERRLFLYQWRKRASKTPKIRSAKYQDLMAHQLYDSSSKTWLCGPQLQQYHSTILPPQEFQGSRIDAKLSNNKNIGSHDTSLSKTQTNVDSIDKLPESRKTSKINVSSHDAMLTKGFRKEDDSSLSLSLKMSSLPKSSESKHSKFVSKFFSIDSGKEKRLWHAPNLHHEAFDAIHKNMEYSSKHWNLEHSSAHKDVEHSSKPKVVDSDLKYKDRESHSKPNDEDAGLPRLKKRSHKVRF